jgi:FKBP-type peptidyl-prolyl cis-trans isomerase
MNKRKGLFSILVFLSIILLLHACDKEDKRIEEEKIKLQKYLQDNGYSDILPTESGLYYVILEDSDGDSPAPTHHVMINFTGSLIDGKVFETSDYDLAVTKGIFRTDKLYGPTKLSLSGMNIPGLTEGLLKMKTGGKSRIIIPSRLAFYNVDYGIIPPFSTLIYDVELLEVIPDPVVHEQALLDSYLEANNIIVDPTESGLYFVEEVAGTGDLPRNYNTVTLHYKGSLLDGREFDRSVSGSPLIMSMGSTTYIAGFFEGVQMMRKNGKAKLIIPWDIAYGASGSITGKVPPYSTIVFEVEIIDIK